MMNNKIPVVLVFCLIAVSVSLAQSADEQDVLKESQTYYNAEELQFFSFNAVKYFKCVYRLTQCKISVQTPEPRCEISETNQHEGDCPILDSKHITVKLTGDELSYSGLKFKNPDFNVIESSPGKEKIRKTVYKIARSNWFFADYTYRPFDISKPFIGIHIFGTFSEKP
eukprot:Nk52_evm10s160 gene=Nk52_evmTU10s160